MLRRDHARGQTMVELALVAPLFFMVIFGIIILGIGVFYQQQVANAAREAARYAIVNTGSAQCPTVSNREPDLAVYASSYWPCDPPATRWPKMTASARDAVFGINRSQLHVSACWSGYWTKDTLGVWADWDASASAPNELRTCTIGGVDPRTSADSLPCPAPPTSVSDDMASSYSASNYGSANQVTTYACYVWRPPLAGFLLIPPTVTLRAVVTEALQYQQ
ncbi:MAG TPA: TadE family protein [Nonomuraea sp.]|nr:TadE family protein [Nonomuraea sp.]